MDKSETIAEHKDTSDEAVDKVNKTDTVQAKEETEPALTNVIAPAIEVTPKSELSEEELKLLNQLMLDLRWMIIEGYVTEYGQGHLFAPPPIPEPKLKDSKSKDATKAETETETEKTNDKEPEKTLQPEEVSSEDVDETIM